jgi:hypothetical protein
MAAARSDANPHWLCVVITLIPLALAVFLVWYFPPGPWAAPK